MKTELMTILIAGTALTLGACATLPGIDTNCPLPGVGPGPYNCPSRGFLPLSTPMVGSDLAAQFDAAKLNIDFSGSNVGIPNSGLFNITLSNNAGQPVSQASFSWSKSGNMVTINDPVAVHNWIASVPSNLGRIEAQFVSLPLDTHIGVNAYMLSMKYDGTLVGSAGKVWMESCNTGPQSSVSTCLPG